MPIVAPPGSVTTAIVPRSITGIGSTWIADPASLAAGKPIRLKEMHTMADGIAVGEPGKVSYAHVADLVDEVVTVTEESLSRAVLLCLELTSLHVQPSTMDVEQIVSHALFGDAATAVVVTPERGRLEVVATGAVTDPSTADHMTWTVTDHGFRMTLSRHVPDVLGKHARDAVEGLLAGHGLTVPEVRAWAVHPGGPRILDTVQHELGRVRRDAEPVVDLDARDFRCNRRRCKRRRGKRGSKALHERSLPECRGRTSALAREVWRGEPFDRHVDTSRKTRRERPLERRRELRCAHHVLAGLKAKLESAA